MRRAARHEHRVATTPVDELKRPKWNVRRKDRSRHPDDCEDSVIFGYEEIRDASQSLSMTEGGLDQRRGGVRDRSPGRWDS